MLRRRQPTASSFHLWWALADGAGAGRRLREVGATVEVLTAPAVPSLYFWALQVSFVDAGGRRLGAAHTGLQWHPGAPSGAVNWGGYHEGGGELAGTPSAMPAVDSANTVHLPWSPGRPYRFRVWSPSPGAWRSEVTDVQAARTAVVRDLLVGADGLAEPVCWSEVFAPCRAPSATVRWSELRAVDDRGCVLVPTALRPSYQAADAGGCPNTASRADPDGGVLQTTGLPSPRDRSATEPIAYHERPVT